MMSMVGKCPKCGTTGSGRDLGCDEGWNNPLKCPHFESQSAAETPNHARDANTYIVPWTGNKLGIHSLSLVCERSSARILGLIGLPSAGKTTFLMMLYLMLSHGHSLKSGRFAGSLTLEAWEALARRARRERPDPPHFPPHTPFGQHDEPGLLHLALRTPERRLQEVVLSDASGEWFQHWTDDPDLPEAEGARWIIKNASACLLFIDCARLAEEEAGDVSRYVLLIQKLTRRLADHIGHRRLVVLWAKADCRMLDSFRIRIENVLSGLFPDAHHVQLSTTSVRGSQGEFDLRSYLDVIDLSFDPQPSIARALPSGSVEYAPDAYFQRLGSQ